VFTDLLLHKKKVKATCNLERREYLAAGNAACALSGKHTSFQLRANKFNLYLSKISPSDFVLQAKQCKIEKKEIS
jgi:hypothetical protein